MATTNRTTRTNGTAGAKGQAPRKKPEPAAVPHLSVAERIGTSSATRVFA